MREYARHLRRILCIRLAECMPIVEWLPSYSFKQHLLPDLTTGIILASIMLPDDVIPATFTDESVVSSVAMPLLYSIFGSSRYLFFGTEEATALAPWYLSEYRNEVHRSALGTVFTFITGLLLMWMGVFQITQKLRLSKLAANGLLAGAISRIVYDQGKIMLHLPFQLLTNYSVRLPTPESVIFVVGLVGIMYYVAFYRLKLSQRFTQPRRSQIEPSFGTKMVKVASSKPRTSRIPNLLPLGIWLGGIVAQNYLSVSTPFVPTENVTKASKLSTMQAFEYVISTLSFTETLHLVGSGLLSTLSIYLVASAMTRHAGSGRTKRTSNEAFGELNMNREVIGYGFVCLCSVSLHTLYPPVACLVRTALVLQFGRTQVASIIAAILALVFSFCDVYRFVLMASPARAAIFILSVFPLCDVSSLLTLFRLCQYTDAAIWTACCTFTILFGVYTGSFVALALTFASHFLLPSFFSIEHLEYDSAEINLFHQEAMSIWIVRLESKTLSIPQWERLEEAIEHKLFSNEFECFKPSGVILNLEALQDNCWDTVSIEYLDAWQYRLHMQGIQVALINSSAGFEACLERFHILHRIVGKSSQQTREEATDAMLATEDPSPCFVRRTSPSGMRSIDC